MTVSDSLLDFFFPQKCLYCGKIGAVICPSCVSSLPFPKTQICPICYNPSLSGKTHDFCQKRYNLNGLTFCFYYDGKIKEAIKKIKYRYLFSLADKLIEVGIKKIAQQMFTDFIIIPVPLHQRRMKTRGFNQAEVIGKSLMKYWSLTMVKDVLQRVKETSSQVKLSQIERRNNVKNAFMVKSKDAVKDKSVLLVDDIFTSGATLNECAKVLKKAGVKEVWGFTLAHGS